MKKKKKNIAFLLIFSFVFLSFRAPINAKEKFALESIEGQQTQVFLLNNNQNDEETLKEMERVENEKIQSASSKARTSVYYDIKLEFYRYEYKQTGYKLAGNQDPGGVNFGKDGGAFGYSDNNSVSPVSMSFGVSGYGISASVGVGRKEKAGVNGYNINAPANRYVKLYVNRTVRAITYKRYKVWRHNGVKEPYGYTTSLPTTYNSAFDVR